MLAVYCSAVGGRANILGESYLTFRGCEDELVQHSQRALGSTTEPLQRLFPNISQGIA